VGVVIKPDMSSDNSTMEICRRHASLSALTRNSTTSATRAVFTLLVLCFATLSSHHNVFVEANFRNRGRVKWTYDLPPSITSLGDQRRVIRGNAVQVSQDGGRVFVTERDGGVHVVRTGDVSRSTGFHPVTQNGVTTSCSSGVALQESKGSVEYAVYAVVDTNDATGATRSRVMALDKDGVLIWTVSLNGSVVGTPYISADGTRIYVVNNEPNSDGAMRGGISVIRLLQDDTATPGASRTAQVTATIRQTDDGDAPMPFGPPTAVSVRQGANTKDVIFVAVGDYAETAGARAGAYVLVPSDSFDRLGGQGEEAYSLRLVSDYPLPALVRPTVNSAATNLYLAHGNRLTGWDEGQNIARVIDGGSEDVFPEWEQRFQGPDDNEDART